MLKSYKKIISFSCLFTCLFFVLLFTNSFLAYAEESKKLTFVSEYPKENFVVRDVFKPFFEKTKKEFNNKIEFEYVIYPTDEAFKAFTRSDIDFAIFRPSFYPHILHLLSVIDIPGIIPNALVGAFVISDLLKEFPEVLGELPEYAIPFTAWTSASHHLHSLEPIKNIDDMQGKTFIVWDRVGKLVIERLGANTILLMPHESYDYLKNDQVDGVYAPFSISLSYKLDEFVKHHLVLDLGVTTFISAIAQNIWENFTPKEQVFFRNEGHEKFSVEVGKNIVHHSYADIKDMQRKGHTFYELSNEEKFKIKTRLRQFKVEWIGKMNDYKHDIELTRKILNFVEERTEYHTKIYNSGKFGDYSIK